MPIAKSKLGYLQKELEEQALKDFERALAHDKVIVPVLKQILTSRTNHCDRRDDLINDPLYQTKRAYLDGRLKELGWLGELLTLD